MKSYRYILFLIVLLGFVVNGCHKPERDNPWDELAKLDPEEWAPQNFQIEDVSITEKKLSWTYVDKNIEGFKLDRKRGDEPWQVGYQLFSNELRSWNDTNVIPSIDLKYEYRLYAFAGNISSAGKSLIFHATIPEPDDLFIETNSASSVTLNWSYNLPGNEGFKVERKMDNGNWQTLTNNLNADQLSFTDDGLDLRQHDYSYRINAFWGAMQSDFVEGMAYYTPTIGEYYKGGIVFYLDDKGGGLVCAETDQSAGAEWGCYNTVIGDTDTVIGTGEENTAKIVERCGETYIAAHICSNLVLNGFSDWYLPSADELNLMYENLKLAGIGGFEELAYWSSSEFNSGLSYKQHFINGNKNYVNKYDLGCVRAVRAF